MPPDLDAMEDDTYNASDVSRNRRQSYGSPSLRASLPLYGLTKGCNLQAIFEAEHNQSETLHESLSASLIASLPTPVGGYNAQTRRDSLAATTASEGAQATGAEQVLTLEAAAELDATAGGTLDATAGNPPVPPARTKRKRRDLQTGENEGRNETCDDLWLHSDVHLNYLNDQQAYDELGACLVHNAAAALPSRRCCLALDCLNCLDCYKLGHRWAFRTPSDQE